jgi:Tol biopolymer transport system component/tRNA A-37 threonylcarbamoyl transferase component Bud32
MPTGKRRFPFEVAPRRCAEQRRKSRDTSWLRGEFVNNAPERLTSALADRYRIERELGQGGMATVYLAEDIKHHRKVAIKVLRPELAAVIGAERFLSEIKTTANLQHPHILALHDSGEIDGIVFYVMPYVQGESLRDRLNREHQLPVDDAVRIAREVADALDYAHRHGVIHRDIKPENVLLHDGRVQVADFGIALAVSRSDGATRMTETGMSLGTPHYMAPEQAMGEREITPRADIYALGCMTYEMLCGEPPFTGPTAQAIIARMMTEEPRPLTLQRKSIPPHVEAAVRTALERLPADRMATAAEFAAALANPGYVTRSGTAARATSGRNDAGARSWLRPGVAAIVSGLVLGGLGVAAGWLMARPREVPAPRVQFTLALPDSARYVDAFGRSVTVSPEGSMFVYTGGTEGQNRLFIRRLDEQQPRAIPGTDGGYMPFFSPDGEWLGFVANQRLMKVRLSGGAPTPVAQLMGNVVAGATWGIHDDIVLEDVSGLVQVKASGGKLAVLVPLDSLNLLIEWPSFLPDGDAVLCSVSGTDSKSRIGVITVPDGKLTVFDNILGTDPRFIAPGTVMWLSPDGVILAAPFDVPSRRFSGTPVPVMENVVEDFRGAKVAIGPGVVVRVEGTSQRAQMLRFGRDGTGRRSEMSGAQDYTTPRFSPDGRRVAFVSNFLGGELWVADRTRGTLQRLALAGQAIGPEWSPDGRRLVFGYITTSSASWDIYVMSADGSGAAEPLITTSQTEFPAGWAADGSLVFWRSTMNRGDILYRDTSGTEQPFATSEADERSPVLSPDGRWLAYVSDESGRREVYVRPFPTGAGRWQISSEGGIEPRWSKGGREIIYRDRGWLLAVPVVPGMELTVGRVDSLFRGAFAISGLRAQYDVSADGSELLVVGVPPESRTLSVILNPLDRVGQ